MAESSTPSPVKPTLEVGIIAAFTLAANKLIADADLKQQATTAAPFVGGGVAWGLRKISKYIQYRRLLSLERDWLAEAQAERAKPGLGRKQLQELDAVIAQRKSTIEQLQRDNLKLQ